MIKLRAKSNRRRVVAIKYNGNNAKEVEEFIGYKLVEEKNHEYLKSQVYTIKKGEWILKEILDNHTLSCEFSVMTIDKLKEKYIIKGAYYAGQGNRKNNRKSKEKKI